jgi:peptidyl-prolyl cis-trans isomerase D
MITWMQKHRKYLVVTLWISTIAFVGAGFVGWGQYNYGAKSSNVAIVGDIEITGGELQDTYSNIYGYYNQLFQGKFDQEMAQKFNVEQQALTTLINQALLLNLASYYDLQTTDEEVLQELIKIPAFQKDGYFNKEIYEQVLMNARTTKKAFEAKMQKELTVQKLQPLLNSELTNYERSVAKTMLAIADKIEYKVLSLDDMSVALNKETIKAFWETRKESYQTDKQYKVELLTHPITSKTLDDATLITYYDAKKI